MERDRAVTGMIHSTNSLYVHVLISGMHANHACSEWKGCKVL